MRKSIDIDLRKLVRVISRVANGGDIFEVLKSQKIEEPKEKEFRIHLFEEVLAFPVGAVVEFIDGLRGVIVKSVDYRSPNKKMLKVDDVTDLVRINHSGYPWDVALRTHSE